MDLFKGFLREFLISRWNEDYTEIEFDEEVLTEMMDYAGDIFVESELEEFLDAVLYEFLVGDEDDVDEDVEDDIEEEVEDEELEDEDEFYDDDDIEESVGQRVTRIRKGKKQKVRLKKGFKRTKDGKLKKMSSKEKRARKKAGKRIGRKRSTGASKIKRAKSMRIRKARRIGEAVDMGTAQYICRKGFAFTFGDSDQEYTVQEGYTVFVEDVDGGNVSLMVADSDSLVIYEGLEIESEFLGQCLESELLESLQVTGETVDEAVVSDARPIDEVVEDSTEKPTISYKEGVGYLFVSEGARYTLGNKIRARSFLIGEGYSVSEDILERAKEEVVLIENKE